MLVCFSMLDLVSQIAPSVWAQIPSGKPPAPETPTHGYVITKPVKGSDIPADYTFVLTQDEIYLPIAVRKPKGNGPFPVITMGWGEGKGGMRRVEELVERLTPMQDRMIARGYVVVTVKTTGMRSLTSMSNSSNRRKISLTASVESGER